MVNAQVYLGDAEWAGEGEGEDPLGDVVCMECGRGDDEDNLMLCDGAHYIACDCSNHYHLHGSTATETTWQASSKSA